MADFAGRCDSHPARLIARFEKIQKVVTVKTIDRRFPAANRPADRMIFEEVDTEKIMDIIVRGVFRLGDFLQDHRALALDLLGVETRMEKNIAEQVDRQRQVFVENLGVVAGMLFGSKSVDHAADGVHLFGDLRRRCAARCL